MNDILLQYVGATDWNLENAYAINESGWIVGDASYQDEEFVPFFFIPPSFDAEENIIANAEIFRLSSEGLQGFSWDLTDNGDAVIDTFFDWGEVRSVAVFDGLLDETIAVGISGSVPVRAMNNALQVVGATGGTGTGQSTQAYVYDYVTDFFTTLPLLGVGADGCDSESNATGINNSGLVVGWSTTASIPINKKRFACGPLHAFSWTAENGMTDLGTLGGATSRAWAVSDSNEVTGTATDANGVEHIFLYAAEFSGMVSVTGGIENPPADASGFVPNAMNSSRVIVGVVTSDVDPYRIPFMLVPVSQ